MLETVPESSEEVLHDGLPLERIQKKLVELAALMMRPLFEARSKSGFVFLGQVFGVFV